MLKKKSFLSVLSFMLAILMFLLSFPTSATTISETAPEGINKASKIDKALLEVMSEASPDEKIPVAIWYNDIDQEEVDTLTAVKVGFDKDNVAIDYEMPSTELLMGLKEGEAEAEVEFKSYLERTESKRLEEKRRTDNYIMSRREISREKYGKHSDEFIGSLNINKNDITFVSQYAPLIEIVATKELIYKLEKNQNIIAIEYNAPVEEEVEFAFSSTDDTRSATILEVFKKAISYEETVSKLGLDDPSTDFEIKIGMFEIGGNIPRDNTTVPLNQFHPCGAYSEYDHVLNTVEIFIGSNIGLVSKAHVYSTNTTKRYIEDMISDHNLTLLNASVDNPGNPEKWYNHLVSYHSVTIIASAGNISPSEEGVISPARCSNVIAVGKYSTNGTTDLNDDYMDSSCYQENTNAVEKPDVVLPSPSGDNGGTSAAAPALTACVALISELKPEIMLYPQVVKAIVLASCDRKVNPSADGEDAEELEDGITERQGAGAFNFWNMACIVCTGTYGVGELGPTSTEEGRNICLPSYSNSHANISVAWLSESVHASNFTDDNQEVTDANCENLGISLYRGNSFVDESDLEHSSTEKIYFQLTSDPNYKLFVTRAFSTTTVRFGYAYCVDEPVLFAQTKDTVCYLRNYQHDTYLTLDPSTGETSMEAFNGTTTQMWILKETDYYTYSIISGYGSNGFEASKLTMGNSINSTNECKAVTKYSLNENSTPIDLSFCILTNTSYGGNEAAVALVYPDPQQGFNNYYLTCKSGLGSLEPRSMIGTISKDQTWVQENVGYVVGDLDINGTINVKDSTIIQKYVSGLDTVSNMGYELADVNGDNDIDIKDATVLQRYVSGLDTLSNTGYELADVNSDNDTDIKDAIYIQ